MADVPVDGKWRQAVAAVGEQGRLPIEIERHEVKDTLPEIALVARFHTLPVRRDLIDRKLSQLVMFKDLHTACA